MKWIKYKVVQDTSGEEVICLTKKIGYNEANLAIAQAEAYNGEYTIEEDATTFEQNPLGVNFGGTGATTAAQARNNLGITPANIGAATAGHGHTLTSLSGTLSVEKGGTGATTAAAARTNLGITPANIGAVVMKTATASLSASGWSNNKQTVSVSGVMTSNTVIVTAAPASYEHYNECAVRCSAQGNGTLTFACTDKPTANLTANVLILM